MKANELNLVEAAQVLGLGYRQTLRVWKRHAAEGDAGLVRRLCGQAGHRRKAPELRAKILARDDERYSDFGPTRGAAGGREHEQARGHFRLSS